MAKNSGFHEEIAPYLERPPLLIVLSGPSGVGKDTVVRRMKALGCPFHFVVTCTTRPKRPREVEGADYHFVSQQRYHSLLEKGELLEHAEIFGYLYGVPKTNVREALARGEEVLLRIDVQGAGTIKRLAPEAVFIFLIPASVEELVERLKRRKTESPADLERRIITAREEMACLANFDYVVVNRDGGVDEAVADIMAILRAEKCRTNPRKVEV
jgi:guanylate kinase